MKKFFLGLLIGILIISIPVALAAMQIFSDVVPDSWYEDATTNLYDFGIIEGYEDGTYKPGNNVTRAELAVMFDRLLEHERALDNNCDKLTAYTSHSWFATLNQKYVDEFLTPLEIEGDIGSEYGKGCLLDIYFVFMPGQNAFGCHELYAYDTKHDVLEKAVSEENYCANTFTDFDAFDSVSFTGSHAEGGVCSKTIGKYYYKENRLETTIQEC